MVIVGNDENDKKKKCNYLCCYFHAALKYTPFLCRQRYLSAQNQCSFSFSWFRSYLLITRCLRYPSFKSYSEYCRDGFKSYFVDVLQQDLVKHRYIHELYDCGSCSLLCLFCEDVTFCN